MDTSCAASVCAWSASRHSPRATAWPRRRRCRSAFCRCPRVRAWRGNKASSLQRRPRTRGHSVFRRYRAARFPPTTQETQRCPQQQCRSLSRCPYTKGLRAGCLLHNWTRASTSGRIRTYVRISHQHPVALHFARDCLRTCPAGLERVRWQLRRWCVTRYGRIC